MPSRERQRGSSTVLGRTVPVHYVEDAVAELQACTDPPPSEIKLTIYPDADHSDAWTHVRRIGRPRHLLLAAGPALQLCASEIARSDYSLAFLSTFSMNAT